MPNSLHVELQPGSAAPAQTAQSRVVFYNADSKGAVTFSLDGGEECRLGAREFATRLLQPGTHHVDAQHWDVFKMKGTSTLQVDDAEMFVAIFVSVYSTHAAFANELPTDFVESCIDPSVPAETPSGSDIGEPSGAVSPRFSCR